jgi:hypothetical protein
MVEGMAMAVMLQDIRLTQIGFAIVWAQALVVFRMMQGFAVYVAAFFFGSLFVFGRFLSRSFNLAATNWNLGKLDQTSAEVFGRVFVILGLAVILAFMIARLSVYFKRRAQKLSRISFEKLTATDQRPHILFLRSFQDD